MIYVIGFLKVVRDFCIAVAAYYAVKLLDERIEDDEKSE